MEDNIKQKLSEEMTQYLKDCGFDLDVIKENYSILGKPGNFRESLIQCLSILLDEFETNTANEDYYIMFDGDLNIIIDDE